MRLVHGYADSIRTCMRQSSNHVRSWVNPRRLPIWHAFGTASFGFMSCCLRVIRLRGECLSFQLTRDEVGIINTTLDTSRSASV